MRIYFDGGCKPNPGMCEVGVISADSSIKFHGDVGYGTNNQAEWMAFLLAVELCGQFADQPVEIIGDSKLVIMQAQGLWKCNLPLLQDYQKQFWELRPRFTNLKLTHVLRRFNLAGIMLEELGK